MENLEQFPILNDAFLAIIVFMVLVLIGLVINIFIKMGKNFKPIEHKGNYSTNLDRKPLRKDVAIGEVNITPIKNKTNQITILRAAFIRSKDAEERAELQRQIKALEG